MTPHPISVEIASSCLSHVKSVNIAFKLIKASSGTRLKGLHSWCWQSRVPLSRSSPAQVVRSRVPQLQNNSHPLLHQEARAKWKDISNSVLNREMKETISSVHRALQQCCFTCCQPGLSQAPVTFSYVTALLASETGIHKHGQLNKKFPSSLDCPPPYPADPHFGAWAWQRAWGQGNSWWRETFLLHPKSNEGSSDVQ